MLNYNHLYYFYVSAKLNGVTAAAKQLHTSQPSLSAQIKSLERELERKLFRKRGRQLELTEDGQNIYSYCKRMFEIAEDLEGFTRANTSLRRARVAVGVSPEIEVSFVAQAINSVLWQNQTRPLVSVFSHAEAELRRDLKLGKIDFLISDSIIDDQDFEVKATIEMPVVFFMSPDLFNELKIRNMDSINEVIKKSIEFLALATPDFRLRHETNLFLEKNKVRIKPIFESDSLDSVTRTVVDGMGVGLLPLPYIMKEARRGLVKVISPPEGLWQHKIYVTINSHLIRCFFLNEIVAALSA